MATLGVAMIVKDGGERLRTCLLSLAGVAERIVMADTGSSDGSAELARELGAEVFALPWPDHFAVARNAAMRALSTDWVLAIDDDEELDAEAGRKIKPLLENAAVGGYFVTHRNHIPEKFAAGGHGPAIKAAEVALPGAEGARAHADFAICRLFRRHPGIFYVGRVHEHVEPSILNLGLKIAHSDLVIHHFGHLASAEELRKKNEYYRKLGRLKVQDAPNDAEAWVELGLQEYEQFKNYPAGMECLKKALILDPAHPNVAALALANLYIEIQADARALELLDGIGMKGRAAGAKEQARGDALYNLGRLKEARAAYLRGLAMLPEDALLAGKLGLTEVRLGLKKNGLARLRQSLEENPERFEMHDRMIKAYLVLRMMPEAGEAAERMARAIPHPAAFLRAAGIWGAMPDGQRAEESIDAGLRLFPQSAELLQAKAEMEMAAKTVTEGATKRAAVAAG